MDINVKTLTPTYDKLEDRIRLSINYQDMDNRIDFMITRSFIIQLLPVVEEYLYKHYFDFIERDDELHIELKDEVNTQTNRSTTNMEDIYLYESLQDLLITINLKYDEKTRLTHFEFISKDTHKALTVCDFDMLQNIIASIKTAIPNYSWGISTHI